MDSLLDSIRIAISEGASDEERRRGADACRALVESFGGAQPSEPAQPAPPAANPFLGMTPDQILELAIARLRGVAKDGPTTAPAGIPIRITLVPVPRLP
jgi:hypothetical protein